MENLYTNECTSMYAMFYECRSLVNIDISNFDTSNCKNMSYMFFDCSQLTIDCSKWNISNIITHNYFNSSAPNVKAPIWNQ